MKTARERAEEFIYKHVLTSTDDPIFKALEELLIEERKEQDKITRHACAEAVLQYTTSNKAHMVCMNVKAV